MAELAAGAVSKLLGVIHNEALLLGRVHGDFIKEEMESINSFLARLAKTATAGIAQDDDDEQLRTWMKQVRELAHDCSNCIDIYLRRGDPGHPAIHRARGSGLRRYLWWASWFVHRMVAQRSAAIQLRDLKERARDVSERRSRYDVKVPEKEAAGGPASTPALAAEDEDDDQNQAIELANYCSGPGSLEPRVLEDYCAEKLVGWLKLQADQAGTSASRLLIPSITLVAPDTEDSGSIAREVLDLAAINFDQTVCINLPQVHRSWDLPLLPQEILCYILQACSYRKNLLDPQAKGEGETLEPSKIRAKAYSYRKNLLDQIGQMIGEIDFNDKIEEIKSKIGQVETKWSKNTSGKHKLMILGVLHQALTLIQIGPDMQMPLSWEEIMDETARMLKYNIEAVDTTAPKHNVFSAKNKVEEARTTTAPALGEDHIKEIIHNHKIALDIIRELMRGNSGKEQATCFLGGIMDHDATADAKEEAKQKMDDISLGIEEQLHIKGVADKINKYMTGKKTLIVFQDDRDCISPWEDTRNALSLINCSSGIDVTPQEFAMKIFVHDLYANPNRSSQDLRKLHDDLDSCKSVGEMMLKFSYNNLPRAYKSCLLYLAIFPPGFNIRRSNLVGRWVAEGLITKEDWASVVRHAEQCFDTLIDRWLVYSAEVGATGGVKSCIVGDKAHEFISKIATKEHILDARLSHIWARHFSIPLPSLSSLENTCEIVTCPKYVWLY
uniref:Uncharacterized protein n=1 Tax=Oryza nivara TaxID=4536 RepID=A0A0E0HBT7_ORYNI